MRELPLGEFIRQRRRDLGMTQGELCEGICDIVTISRIENGKQTPTRRRMTALLERLGAPSERFYALVPEKEMRMEVLEEEIIDCNIRGATVEGLEKLRELEAMADADDNFAQQMILRSKAILGREDGPYRPEEQLELLLQAIRLTVPRFAVDRVECFLYSLNEVKIINQIAIAYVDLDQQGQALDIYRQLLSYIQSHFQNVRQSAGHLPLVSFNYALELVRCKRYEEGIEIAELGRKTSVHYGHYQFLPGLLHIIAECAHFLGDDEKSMNDYRQTYYLYLALEDTKNLSNVLDEVHQYFGPQFCFL